MATTTARDGDDEVTLTSGPRRVTGGQLLIMTPDDVRNTKFLSAEDHTSLQYTVTTKSVGSGPKACVESVLMGYMGDVRQLVVENIPGILGRLGRWCI